MSENSVSEDTAIERNGRVYKHIEGGWLRQVPSSGLVVIGIPRTLL